jgi:hypothetical protein
MSGRPSIAFSASDIAAAIARGIRNNDLPAECLNKNMLHSLIGEGAAEITYRG